MRRPALPVDRGLLAGVLLCASAFVATPAAHARSDALDAVGIFAGGVGSLGPAVGLAISLRRGERATEGQLIGGYLFTAINFAIGSWVAADPQFGSTGFRLGVAAPILAIGAATLPLTILAHLRRGSIDPRAAPAPWGEVIDGIVRNSGVLVSTVAFVANGDSPGWLALTALAGVGLALDIRRALSLSEAAPSVSVAPMVIETARRSVAMGAMVRIVAF